MPSTICHKSRLWFGLCSEQPQLWKQRRYKVNDSDSTLTLIMQSPSTTPATGVQTCPAMPGQILSREGLWEHLQWAIELEHSTIPGYLCALYSIESGDNPEATEVVSSVLVEEMLHLT